MSNHSNPIVSLNALFDEPQPLDRFINAVLATLVVTQQEFADAAGLNQTAISKLANRKTTTPSASTLEKIRHALVEVYGADPERATFEFLAACRALTDSVDADQVDSRFLEIDEWLRTQPDDVRESFWETLTGLVNTFDALRKG